MTDPLTPTLLDELEQRLQSLAITVSSAARSMAEMKSLRQEGNHERRSDLYFWPEPHETDYGKALAAIRFLRDQSGEVEAAVLAEREACARVVETWRENLLCQHGYDQSIALAEAIRARAALGSERG